MPPSGTTGKSSSKTGARGPTGPSGEARSSPAGNRGGAPGATSRTSSGGMKSGPGSTGGSKTPGGSRGGGSGNSSISNMRSGPGSTGGRKTPSSSKATPARPTGPRGPTGPGGERRAFIKDSYTGVGERFGPPSNDIQDIRKMQGPRTPPTIREIERDYSRELNDLSKKWRREDLGTVAGAMSRTGAEYGMRRADIDKQWQKADAAFGREYSIKDGNRDRSLEPTRDTAPFRQEVSKMVPNTTLPSRQDIGERAMSAYSQARNAYGDALYGPKTPGGKSDFGGYRGGGLATSRRSYKIK